MADSLRKSAGNPAWAKGVSGNPNGRPALSPVMKKMRNECLEEALKIAHEKITDRKYMDSLAANELIRFLEMCFDRFGFPKVTKSEFFNDEEQGAIRKIVYEWARPIITEDTDPILSARLPDENTLGPEPV
jgi:hypothetical protein